MAHSPEVTRLESSGTFLGLASETFEGNGFGRLEEWPQTREEGHVESASAGSASDTEGEGGCEEPLDVITWHMCDREAEERGALWKVGNARGAKTRQVNGSV